MKPFTTIAVIIFTVIFIAHVLRLIFGWTVVFNGAELPVWGSIVGAIVSGLLAVMVWRENK